MRHFITKRFLLEEEQLDCLKLSREQVIVVRSILGSVNQTLYDIATHEMLLPKELRTILNSLNVGNKKTEDTYASTALYLAVNSHAMRLHQAIGEVKNVYDTIILICLHWKNGIVHPQVLPAARLLEILRMSQDSFPHDLEVPIELSETYAYLLYTIISVDVFLVKGNLVYIVQTPLVMHSVFHVFKVIPYPVEKKDAEGIFTLKQPEKPFVMIDKVKGLYAKIEHTDLQQCKRKKVRELICKQHFPLFLTHSSTDCEILMLNSTWSAPQSCIQQTVELRETRWVSLTDNAWIYVAPVPESLTVLCKGQKPSDIEIKGNGVLIFLSDCTGHGKNIVITGLTVHSVNNTGKNTIHPLNLTRDCCEVTVDMLTFGEIKLEIPVKCIATHEEEMRLANHKVDRVQELVSEQEWKVNHTAEKERSSLTTNKTLVFVLVLCILCSCCCLCRCRNCWYRVMKWWYFDNNRYGTIVFRHKIVNSISTTGVGRGRRLAVGLTDRARMQHGEPGEIQEFRYSLPSISLQ